MYSDYNRRTPTRRANDAFLRQMLGGELTDGRIASANTEKLPYANSRQSSCSSCPMEVQEVGENTCATDCPKYAHAPSLAMVYAPKQCWRNLLDLHSALNSGSLFAELVLPFEGGRHHGGSEVRPCK